ncbi:hypothetical protein HO173_011266 [Letharia columbiana]|uniref:Uncharacterized protein n=1 Tax=Letharia columbiana TaxID=112416 RepID=A0A8H6FJJ7_9LECA|nr:uncharacterized protein HO173_011266 [Letharia columbiana]KAF6229750.1 hypothetical protein HO173_011266 [Letharia columbiana]
MLYVQNVVSQQAWEPIFRLRARPVWVQVIVCDLLRQLKVLRTLTTTLPSLDSVGLPPGRQFRVAFGDMDALCDILEFIHKWYGALQVAYGGPDDRGTLWIKFYKLSAKGRTWETHMQFIIWIDSRRPSALTLEGSNNQFCGPTTVQMPPIDFRVANYQRKIPASQTRRARAGAPGWSGEEEATMVYTRQEIEWEGSDGWLLEQPLGRFG